MLLDLNKFQISHRGLATYSRSTVWRSQEHAPGGPVQPKRCLKTVAHFSDMCALFSTFFREFTGNRQSIGEPIRIGQSTRMCHQGVLSFLYALLLTTAVCCAEPPIRDPIADYLAMNVPDRIANVGRLLVIKKVEVDMEGNGTNDVFVGTWYRNSGPETWLWAGYAPIAGGYSRITPADSDVLIDFDGIYIGYLPDIGRHGMAQAYSLELNNKDRDQSNMISDLTFYYIEDSRLTQTGTGALDRDDPDQEAKFEYYFGPGRKLSGTPRIESLTVLELAQRGYRIPNWRPAPRPAGAN
jgi:hypothetical protein